MNKQPDELSNKELKEYCYKDEWTLVEAIFLLRGKRPKNTHDYDNEIFIKFTQDKSYVDKDAKDIESQMQYEMDPEDWLSWAMSENIDIDPRTERFLSNISSYTYHKKTVNDVDPFGKPSWNINLVLAWMYSRDPEFVKLFDNEVEDYGTHTNKSGKEVPNRPPRVEDIYNYEHPHGVTPEFSGQEDVESSLINKLLHSGLECSGKENDQVKIKLIQPHLWADMIFTSDAGNETYAANNMPQDPFDDYDETEWHHLRLKRDDILRIWPSRSASIKQEQTKKATSKRHELNNKIKKFAQKLAIEAQKDRPHANKIAIRNIIFDKVDQKAKELGHTYSVTHFPETVYKWVREALN